MTLSSRSNEYPGRQNFSIVDGVHHWKLAVPVQYLGKQAGAVLSCVQNNKNRSWEIPGQCRQNCLQHLQATRRSADDNNVSVRHGSPLELGCGNGCEKGCNREAAQTSVGEFGGGHLNQVLSRGDDQGVGF